MPLTKFMCCLILISIVFVGVLHAQVTSTVEISAKAIMAKPTITNGYNSGFELSPQLQFRIGRGIFALNTELGSGSFGQRSILDEYPSMNKFSSHIGNAKWRNTYLALGPTYRLMIDKNIAIDFAVSGGVSFNKSGEYSVQFNADPSSPLVLQANNEENRTFPIVKPSIMISKYWGNLGVNLYSSWQKMLGDYSYNTNSKDLRKVDFSSDEKLIIQQVYTAPNLEVNNKFPSSILQFGVGVSYTIGSKHSNEPAKASINTSRSNIKQQVTKKDSIGNGDAPQPAKASINTSRSNIKQQVTEKDSIGNGGAPQPAKASINTSRSNIKQ